MTVILGVLALAAITLGDVMRMPPNAAGELLLENRPHGEIVAIVDQQDPYQLPGHYEKILWERPQQRQSGCVRRSWNISFYADGGVSKSDAMLSGVHSYEEVQLISAGSCRGESWVQVAGDDVGRALAALGRFSRKLRGEGKLVQSCRDEILAQLCANDVVTLQGLKNVSPWLVGVRDGKDYILLARGRFGSQFTDVTLGERVSDGMVIVRRIPAPF